MKKESAWGETSIHVNSKKIHSQPIISISPHDQNMFFTSSEDNTIRLWDLRLQSSVKLFRNQNLKNLSNCQSDRKFLLFVGAGQHVHSFDIRNQGILVQQILKQSEQAHFDDVSFIKLDLTDGTVGVSDDQGDVRLYNFDLECTELLDQGHNNIVNAIQYVNNENGKLCVSGGFDCKLVHWRVGSQEIVRQIDLQELFNKHQVKATTMPFIYSIYLHKTTLFVTTETGHVIAFPVKDLKKPKYILEASLARIPQARIAQFNQNILLTLSRDGSFSLFDHTKRQNGAPQFLQKYKCRKQPNSIQSMKNLILVSNNLDAELQFFSIK